MKIAFADQADLTLTQADPMRPAARFNRQGQDALYLSPHEEAARVAIGQYVRLDDPARVLLRFEVSACELFDLRLPENADVYEAARQPWLADVAAGVTPASWEAADHIRAMGYKGLIDPSRRRPGLWHITLFEWNQQTAPSVEAIGNPEPIHLELDYR